MTPGAGSHDSSSCAKDEIENAISVTIKILIFSPIYKN
jgi:hypothetical protein